MINVRKIQIKNKIKTEAQLILNTSYPVMSL